MAKRDDIPASTGAAGLRGIRITAGYPTGRELARELGIPASTYANYEKNPRHIPLRAAWAIADRLGTTIDAVVGREAEPSLDAFYRSLSDEGREMMDGYVSLLSLRERETREGGR